MSFILKELEKEWISYKLYVTKCPSSESKRKDKKETKIDDEIALRSTWIINDDDVALWSAPRLIRDLRDLGCDHDVMMMMSIEEELENPVFDIGYWILAGFSSVQFVL